MQRFWNKIRFRQFTKCADDLECHWECPSRCRSPRVRNPRDRIAAEAVFAPSIGWGADSSFWGMRWVGVVMGILHNNWDGAPGRTRTSTDVNPPDFESGASTNSATGAPTGALPGARHPVAARIIAKTGWSASHWTAPTFPQDFSRPAVARGMKFADIRCPMIHRDRRRSAPIPGKYNSNAANIWLY